MAVAEVIHRLSTSADFSRFFPDDPRPPDGQGWSLMAEPVAPPSRLGPAAPQGSPSGAQSPTEGRPRTYMTEDELIAAYGGWPCDDDD